jgi:predicted dinucleotide-binding enzyme
MTGREVAFLGGGRMGEALVSGLIRSGGRTADEIVVTCRRDERALELKERYGVTATLSNPEAVDWAETLVLMVKPQDMETLLGQIAGSVHPGQTVITFAAGIRTSFVERHLPAGIPVVRVMSNVAVLVDEAMSVVSAGSHADEEQLEVAEALAPGRRSIEGTQQDAITATSAPGPRTSSCWRAMIEGRTCRPVTGRRDGTIIRRCSARRRCSATPASTRSSCADGHLARRDHDRRDPPPRGGRGPGGLPERDRRRPSAERRARAGRRGRGTRVTDGGGPPPMGRGDRARVRWAHDRERKKKQADKRKAAQRAAERKAAAKK